MGNIREFKTMLPLAEGFFFRLHLMIIYLDDISFFSIIYFRFCKIVYCG